MLFSKKQSLVGLDIGSHAVKVVELEAQANRSYRLVNWGISAPLAEAIVDGEVMDRQMVVDAVANLFESRAIKSRNVVAAVSGRAVIVKKITMNRLSSEDAQQAVYWEAEQHVPYDINDVSLDFEILGAAPNDPKQMQVLLVAAKKDMVMAFSDLIREAGLQPSIVDVDSFAAQNALEANYEFAPEEVVAILNSGAEITNINIVQGGVPYFTKDLQVGGHSFIEAAQRKFNLSQAEAAAAVRGESGAALEMGPVIESACEGLATALERAQAYLRTAGEAGPVTRIMLCGGSALTPGLPEFLNRRFGVPAEIANPLARVTYDPALFAGQDVMKVAPFLTVGLGLALRRLGDKK
ncbi:MAG: type IV pilus assembly protein PilM [Candidatus Eisenbacteria bacterium]|uniref:Type IV pilus assembly protein PilM n=1 Tax=Eiseniibacteriota bacterium TaxID=2212470 RepID=A0A9D6QP66_UNCEI|nr:type IV pilus assembly protein PilM [Candidatus Eisenbacteria bacterium]